MSVSLLPAARAALLGLAVGDALGVPVEFIGREARRRDPVVGMRGYGTHSQPPGTWSDDASLTFCLAETLARPKTVQLLLTSLTLGVELLIGWIMATGQHTAKFSMWVMLPARPSKICAWV